MLLRGAHSERDAAAAAARGAAAATAEEAAAEVQGAEAGVEAETGAEDARWVLTEEEEGGYAADDDELSASNGAGKTTLAMAALWALTGSTDARAGGKPVEARGVINEASPRAVVTLRGTVRSASQHAPGEAEADGEADGGIGGGEANGGSGSGKADGGGDGGGAVAFEVVRVMGRREHTLRFTLGSEEYSGTLAQVQAQLDQVLRAEHLGRVCFFGQVVTMTYYGYTVIFTTRAIFTTLLHAAHGRRPTRQD